MCSLSCFDLKKHPSDKIDSIAVDSFSIADQAVEFMTKTEQDILAIQDRETQEILGIITVHDILKLFEQQFKEENHKHRHIHLAKSTIRVFNRSRQIFARKL